jgi:hypothetical protein
MASGKSGKSSNAVKRRREARLRTQGRCARCGAQTEAILGPWRCALCVEVQRVKQAERRRVAA